MSPGRCKSYQGGSQRSPDRLSRQGARALNEQEEIDKEVPEEEGEKRRRQKIHHRSRRGESVREHPRQVAEHSERQKDGGRGDARSLERRFDATLFESCQNESRSKRKKQTGCMPFARQMAGIPRCGGGIGRRPDRFLARDGIGRRFKKLGEKDVSGVLL